MALAPLSSRGTMVAEQAYRDATQAQPRATTKAAMLRGVPDEVTRVSIRCPSLRSIDP
jgi:hypothetical protein